MGVFFNDSTRLILYNDTEREGTESYLTVSSHPSSLMKISLLKYFLNYMAPL